MQEAFIDYGPAWVSLCIDSDCSEKLSTFCSIQPKAAGKIMNTFRSYTDGIFQPDGRVTSSINSNHAMVFVRAMDVILERILIIGNFETY